MFLLRTLLLRIATAVEESHHVFEFATRILKLKTRISHVNFFSGNKFFWGTLVDLLLIFSKTPFQSKIYYFEKLLNNFFKRNNYLSV